MIITESLDTQVDGHWPKEDWDVVRSRLLADLGRGVTVTSASIFACSPHVYRLLEEPELRAAIETGHFRVFATSEIENFEHVSAVLRDVQSISVRHWGIEQHALRVKMLDQEGVSLTKLGSAIRFERVRTALSVHFLSAIRFLGFSRRTGTEISDGLARYFDDFGHVNGSAWQGLKLADPRAKRCVSDIGKAVGLLGNAIASRVSGARVGGVEWLRTGRDGTGPLLDRFDHTSRQIAIQVELEASSSTPAFARQDVSYSSASVGWAPAGQTTVFGTVGSSYRRPTNRSATATYTYPPRRNRHATAYRRITRCKPNLSSYKLEFYTE